MIQWSLTVQHSPPPAKTPYTIPLTARMTCRSVALLLQGPIVRSTWPQQAPLLSKRDILAITWVQLAFINPIAFVLSVLGCLAALCTISIGPFKFGVLLRTFLSLARISADPLTRQMKGRHLKGLTKNRPGRQVPLNTLRTGPSIPGPKRTGQIKLILVHRLVRAPTVWYTRTNLLLKPLW